MPKLHAIKHEFVKFMPEHLEPGILYISLQYKTMVHLCCCGCESKVVTPLSPTGWEMTFNGKAVSVYPSIGNWNLECQSHYWMSNGRVEWAETWSRERIDAVFARDRSAKREYYGEDVPKGETRRSKSDARGTSSSLWSRLRGRWSE